MEILSLLWNVNECYAQLTMNTSLDKKKNGTWQTCFIEIFGGFCLLLRHPLFSGISHISTFSTGFDLLPLKLEQEIDINTRLLNLHDALSVENSPLGFEFHLHGNKVINCGEFTNDILDNLNYKNKEMMDSEEFVLSLLQKKSLRK